MSSRWLRTVGPLVGALALALGMFGASAASAAPAARAHTVTAQTRPPVSEGSGYNFENVATGLWLHGHALTYIITDSGTGLQTWLIGPNCNTVNHIFYCMMELNGTSDCISASTQNGADYLEGCNSGDDHQYFSIENTGTSGWNWIRPYVDTSDFSTDDGAYGQTDHAVWLRGAGAGNYAVFAQACQINC